MEVRKIKIQDLNPSAYNPRVTLEEGDQDYKKLKKSIERFGHVQPIVWNELTSNIVGGHQSVHILKELGETEVNCVVVNLSILEEKTLNIALNKITGRWDIDKLSGLMNELVEEGLTEFTGYGEKEIARITEEFEQIINETGEIDISAYQEDAFQYKCPRCGFLY